MTGKAMPKRIWAWEQDGFRDFDNMAGWKENGIESDFEGAEYIRADLAAGDANEPMADGQYRWFMPCYEDVWRVGVVRTVIEDGWECFAFCTAPGEWEHEIEVDKIGPVIRPPEDM